MPVKLQILYFWPLHHNVTNTAAFSFFIPLHANYCLDIFACVFIQKTNLNVQYGGTDRFKNNCSIFLCIVYKTFWLSGT